MKNKQVPKCFIVSHVVKRCSTDANEI